MKESSSTPYWDSLIRLVHLAMQVQNGEPVTDPAGRVQLIAYVQAYSDPVPKLQSDFQCISKRIGQVRLPVPGEH